jgi:hypothetical protein
MRVRKKKNISYDVGDEVEWRGEWVEIVKRESYRGRIYITIRNECGDEIEVKPSSVNK